MKALLTQNLLQIYGQSKSNKNLIIKVPIHLIVIDIAYASFFCTAVCKLNDIITNEQCTPPYVLTVY